MQLESREDTLDLKVGTPGYTAPEVIRGRPYSFAADIWSAGILLHLILTNKLPWTDDDPAELERKVCEEQLNLNGLDHVSWAGKSLL